MKTQLFHTQVQICGRKCFGIVATPPHRWSKRGKIIILYCKMCGQVYVSRIYPSLLVEIWASSKIFLLLLFHQINCLQSTNTQSPKDIFKPKILKIRDIKSNRGKDTQLRLSKSILCQSTQKDKEQLVHIDSSKVAAYYLVLFGPKGRKSNFLSGHNLRFFVNTVFSLTHSGKVGGCVDWVQRRDNLVPRTRD